MTQSGGGFEQFAGGQSLQTFKLTIEAGSQATDLIQLGVQKVVGIFIPSVFQGSLIAFQISLVNIASEATNVHLPTGAGTTILTIPVITDVFYTLTSLDLDFFPYMRLLSDQTQSVTHTLTIITRT